MPVQSKAQLSLPPQVAGALKQLGEDLSIARLRRKESQRQWAQRVGVSVPTLIRLEQGDPGVGMGVYATALWMMGRTKALAELANPQQDLGALTADIRKIQEKKSKRRSSHVRAN
jgi:transcriptional regulator with XRE-family HTH domain